LGATARGILRWLGVASCAAGLLLWGFHLTRGTNVTGRRRNVHRAAIDASTGSRDHSHSTRASRNKPTSARKTKASKKKIGCESQASAKVIPPARRTPNPPMVGVTRRDPRRPEPRVN
jgi:hypothetical protein